MAFSCGVVHHHPVSAFAKAGWGWPMSRVDLRQSDVHTYTPVLLGRWTLSVQYGEIEEAALHRHRWGGKIRLRRNDGDVTLTTTAGSYVRIARLLREKGVRVTGDQGAAA